MIFYRANLQLGKRKMYRNNQTFYCKRKRISNFLPAIVREHYAIHSTLSSRKIALIFDFDLI